MATVSGTFSEPTLPVEYWRDTRHPFASLVFLAPLLLMYEFGVIWMRQSSSAEIRNGADFWMRGWLKDAGMTEAWLLPILVVSGLLIWQIAGRYPWRLSVETLCGMLAESLVFAFILILAGQLQDMAFHQLNLPIMSTGSAAETTMAASSPGARAITFIGAGVYEEFLFRLCLLPITFALFRSVRFSSQSAALLSVIVTGALFAAAHYVGPAGEQFQTFTFTFRLTAGLFFAGLFYLRGFGITVGAHAAYDLLVGIVLFPAG